MHSVSLQGSARAFSVSKIICVGRNYAEHAKEMKADIPTTPVLFLKPPSALLGHLGKIVIPPASKELHHEVEMTVLIGMAGKNISRKDAMRHIAGYGVGLDMTLRDLQSDAKKKGLPWSIAKGFDTAAPVSEFVPADSVGDPHALDVELRVNGGVRQKGNTHDFLFKLDHLVSLVSEFFTLEQGDILFTGTPEGVGPAVPGDTLLASLSVPGGRTLATLTALVAKT